jgi:hypothetical protein
MMSRLVSSVTLGIPNPRLNDEKIMAQTPRISQTAHKKGSVVEIHGLGAVPFLNLSSLQSYGQPSTTPCRGS